MAIVAGQIDEIALATNTVTGTLVAVLVLEQATVWETWTPESVWKLTENGIATEFVSYNYSAVVFDQATIYSTLGSTRTSALYDLPAVAYGAGFAYMGQTVVELATGGDFIGFGVVVSVVEIAAASDLSRTTTTYELTWADSAVVVDSLELGSARLITETAVATDQLAQSYAASINEAAIVLDNTSNNITLLAVTSELGTANDAPSSWCWVTLAESATVTDAQVISNAAQVLELGRVRDATSNVVAFITSLTEGGLAFADLYQDVAFGVVESLIIVDTLQQSVSRLVSLQESAIAQEQYTETVARGVLLQDSVVATEVLHTTLTIPLVEQVTAVDLAFVSHELSVTSIQVVPQDSVEYDTACSILDVLREVALVADEVLFSGELNDTVFVVVDEYITARDRAEGLSGLDSFAWVFNTQSLSHSYYDNFVPFNSAVQVDGRTFLLSAEGLFELAGDSDNGQIIDAEVVTGMLDFGTIDRKRIEQFDLGYTAAGDIQAYVGCEGFAMVGPYTLEARNMATAHTSRIRVGKGMVGRYWKLHLANREGSDFELFSIQTKVAVSSRRMR